MGVFLIAVSVFLLALGTILWVPAVRAMLASVERELKVQLGVGTFILAAGLYLLVYTLQGMRKDDAARQAAHDAAVASASTLPAMAQVSGVTIANSNKISSDTFAVERARFSTRGVSLLRLAEGYVEPSEQCAARTAEIEGRTAQSGRDPGTVEQLIAEAAEHPEEFAPGPVAALGSSYINQWGHRTVPQILFDKDQLFLYLTTAEPDDCWNPSYKFITVAR